VQIRISQSFWRGHALEPKTRKSKAPVPVTAQLAQRLELHRSLSGNPANGFMFPSPTGKPFNMDALSRDVIVRSQQRQEFSGMAGMPFVAGLRRIFTGLAYPTR